ncbi:MAG: DUF6538 domain-containing protein [Azonexus sp.]
MPRLAPYLQRRGYGLTFRIAIPPDLRAIVGVREITKALPTTDRSEATPLALKYAACAKRMFYELRAAMTAPDNLEDHPAAPDVEKLRTVAKDAKHRIQLDDLKVQHFDELVEQRSQHLKDIERIRLEAENEALRRVLAGFSAPPIVAHSPMPASAPAAPACVPVASAPAAPVPTFKTIVDGFLGKYPQDKRPAMFKKHKAVLLMLLDVVGDKRINELRQADINNFFELLGRLPPRWADQCRKRKLTVQELAELEFDETLGPKSFDDTYIASVRPFLKAAKKDWQDQGFPLGLTTDGIEYLGDREEDENKQRAFKRDELARLFEGKEMRELAQDEGQHHRFWILHLGLFTGARVNEICQINPHTDILQDEESGVWHLWITKETEADPRIRKSVKTGDSRKVPIHHKLIELGFLAYVERLKAAGHKLLFPEWLPINRRASGEAEKWVRQFFRDTKLRDETPKAKILGMHAFRHTLLTYGALQKPPLILMAITGHAQGELPVPVTGAAKGYFTASMLSPLSDRKDLLDQLDYNMTFYVPVTA